MSSSDQLVKLGLNKNDAKALDALISLGPSGAADVHRYSGIPRNKAYESLERLARRGMVEVQQGRPILYKAIGPRVLINNLIEDYGREAKEALEVLEKKIESTKDSEGEEASAWLTKGEQGVKRRLAELIYAAKQDIFAIGGYPPKYPLAVKSALKAAIKRGVKTRVVSMVRPFENFEVPADDSTVIEFRTVKLSSKVLQRVDEYDEKLLGGFRGISGFGGMVIIDESTAFDIVDEGKDQQRVVGIVFRAPGVPRIQKATAERMLGLYTRKL